RRIASILDQAEALRAKRRHALTQLNTLTQSLFLEMFGGLHPSGREWPTTTLDSVADIQTGYPFPSVDYVTSGETVRLCRGANVLPGRIDWSDLVSWSSSRVAEVEEFALRADDIVIAMDRPWISEGFKVARIEKADLPALLVQRVARLRGKNDVSNSFLF